MNLDDKLRRIASQNKSNWVEEAGELLAREGMLRKARQIALRVLQLLKEKNITQTELADRMHVSRQQVTKIVKGQENITLETIDKLEQALGATIITIGAVKTLTPGRRKIFNAIVSKAHAHDLPPDIHAFGHPGMVHLSGKISWKHYSHGETDDEPLYVVS